MSIAFANVIYGIFSTKRTKVIDDEADYFSMDNRWLTKNQQKQIAKRDKELREKRFASRLDRKFTLDFAGRCVVEDEEQNCKVSSDFSCRYFVFYICEISINFDETRDSFKASITKGFVFFLLSIWG